MKGAQILVECLKREKVTTIFGYPGGQLIPIFDALYDAREINLVLTRHEQGAAHAADGFARASGRVGVCMATSGPGATNLVTGIATAYMDSVPMVCITGQVPTSLIGNDAFQEADIVGITRPITKHNYLVKDVCDLARTVREAFFIASSGRPGPVLVDIPKDIAVADTEFIYPETVSIRGYNPTLEGNPRQIKRAAELIMASKRPIIYAGGGVIISGAHEELLQFAEKTGIPVTMTLLGLGAFPNAHPLSIDMLGMHGTVYANNAVCDSDLIISVGARFDDRVTGKLDEFAPHAKIIHIDIDPTSVSKSVEVDVPIVGDAKHVLQELLPQVSKLSIEDWLTRIRDWKTRYPLAYGEEAGIIKPQAVIRKLSELTKGEAIITTEVGQNQMWAAQFYNFTSPRSFITSGGLGTMGYGLPAAIGAQFAFPDKTVIDIAGDGSIQMNIQELATAVVNNLPVKVLILNNTYLGMVRQWQELFYDKRYAATCLDRREGCPDGCSTPGDHCPSYVPDFVKLAEAYGAYGRRVTNPAEVESALVDMLNHKGTAILEVRIAKEENVYPMVPAGAALTQMIGGMA
ncbi:MAG TPA: biosynthetic-type acetolactate synthase large subunit [Spirochaetota bacterium]|nr:biosynthetic-type acetolactate synthase large subunit [Spirochaetota bacterium]HPN82317.1 biosynthetic-type acetolactate synthase large subunit [Spirochaetota bacterium]